MKIHYWIMNCKGRERKRSWPDLKYPRQWVYGYENHEDTGVKRSTGQTMECELFERITEMDFGVLVKGI